jgi:hypothetical protein
MDAINLGSPAPATLAAVGAVLALATTEVVVAMGTEVEASVRGTSMIARKATHARSPTMPAAVAGVHANPRRLATLVAVAAVVGNQSMLALPTAKAALIANPRSSMTPVALVGLMKPVTTPALAAATAVANPGTGRLTTTLSALVALWWSCCPCVDSLGSKAQKSPSLMGNEARSSTPSRNKKENRFVIRIPCMSGINPYESYHTSNQY